MSKDGLDLDGYWLGADFPRVHASKVTKDLIVSISCWVIIIKPSSPTVCKRQKAVNTARAKVVSWRKTQKKTKQNKSI